MTVSAARPAGAAAGYDLNHADSIGLLRRQTRVLELIAAGSPLPEVLTAIALDLEELIEGARCSILLLDPARATLHHGAAPTLPAEYAKAIDGMGIGADAGSCGAAAYLGRQVVAEDITADPRWDGFRAFALPHGLRSCWSSPICGRAGTTGTFAVYHARSHRPTDREQRLVQRFTHLASIAIDHAGLFGALAESEERFRRAFEDNAVGMALTDLDGRLVKVNRALRDMLLRTEHELLGTAMAELLIPAAPGTDQAALLAQASPNDTVHYEADARRSDGRLLRLAVSASAVRGADGSPVNISVNLVDVTQRRAAEQERAARREAEVARTVAEAASRAKSDLLTAVSHELRTPLQAITGFTELLGTLDLSTERRRAALGHIEAATTHILSLVNDVLDIARIESGALPLRMQDVALREVTDDVLNMLRPLADARGVALTRHQVTGTVRADDRRLRQMLINLVTNAIRYNRPAGWVRITSEHDEGEISLHVTDSGPGIPAELIGRLFVPFDRLGAESGPVPGAGLGLALTRGLTEAMGGRLLIESTLDVGTTVSVVLPNRRG